MVDSEHSEQTTWAELADSGRRAATWLRTAGVGPGDRVALVLTNSHGAIAALAGVWFAGATVMSLPVIARGMSADAYRAQIQRLCAQGSACMVVVDPVMRELFADLGTKFATFEDVLRGRDRADPAPPGDEEPAFVQFSSGTTGEPRGATLTAGAIAAQLAALGEAVSIDPRRDAIAAWLPLSHDMGLFGCLLLSWFSGIPLTLGTPLRFLAAPASWLDDCAASGATLSVVPPSVLSVVARAERGGAGVRLRACIVGGERIPPAALEQGEAALSSRGASPAALTPAYGLAEATLAVTVAALDERPRVLAVDEDAMGKGEIVPAVRGGARLVSCGRPIPGASVAIVGDQAVGEIAVRSPSLASGYVGDAKASRTAFHGGELLTHDLGFIRDGELYPLARTDDVLNFGGRRINSAAIEDALGSHPELRAGSCVIVDVAGDERVRFVALAELVRDAPPNVRSLARDLRLESLNAGGPPLDECVFVSRGEIPKTASGKVQRFRARQLAAGSKHGRVVLRP